jgi:hypothetical protein
VLGIESPAANEIGALFASSSCAGIAVEDGVSRLMTRASIILRKGIDCRVKPGNDEN